MFTKLFFLCFLLELAASTNFSEFIFQGFNSANMTLDGVANITPTGLLKLTNRTRLTKGHAFYSHPLRFKNSSSPGAVALSFSTTFVFAIASELLGLTGHGMAFTISPFHSFTDSLPSQYLGLFNLTNDGSSSNRVVAVELDTANNSEIGDIDDNHVGIDINSVRSNKSSPAGYYSGEGGDGGFKNLSLSTRDLMKVWVEYNGLEKQLNVTLSPIHISKPTRPLLNVNIDLSSVLEETMYVGFSSSTGTLGVSHYVLGWSFKINGKAADLDANRLPSLPRLRSKTEVKMSTILLISIGLFFFLVIISTGGVIVVRRKSKYVEILEDWEHEYGPHRFSYKDLFIATNGFKEKWLLGSGGFGRVYKGVLPSSKMEVAVKRVSHGSKQGMKEFVAEIMSLGRLRHRNLVELLGYCRREGELLLVYEYMSNGSLDKFLFGNKQTLGWSQRFRIVKGVASALLYLHEEWEQIVLHRDIKASNVLIDAEFNGRLGDFGLARLYNHGCDPQTTLVVGTLGYIAPELTTTGKATTCTDVFSLGAFMLEVACGRRPMELGGGSEEGHRLVDWVLRCWKRDAILEARDPKLGEDYVVQELELVLKLGLFCSQAFASARPCMRHVIQYLEGDAPLPELWSLYIRVGSPRDGERKGGGSEEYEGTSYRYSFGKELNEYSIENSLLSGGR